MIGPCRIIAPRVEAFSREYTEVAFHKIDVDEVQDIASSLGVRAMRKSSTQSVALNIYADHCEPL